MADVAVRAGVSSKTVSNVINDFPHVSASTRARVAAAIEELGYVPNLGARNLARGRTGVIVLGIPRLDMPYFASLAMQLVSEAERAAWWVQIRQTQGDRATELELVRGTQGSRIDGVVLSPVSLAADDLTARPPDLPLVLLGEQQLAGIDQMGIDHIGIDNVAAARTAVAHLLRTGRRRIAVVGGPWTSDLRVEGARQAMAAAGLGLDRRMHLPVAGVRGQDGERAMDVHLDGGGDVPDAVFCATDWLAMGVIRSLHLRGHRVPRDVAVMGFDDIPYDLSALPTLSTIAPDRAQIARLAVESLQRQERHRDDVGRVLVADHALVVRESTGS